MFLQDNESERKITEEKRREILAQLKEKFSEPWQLKPEYLESVQPVKLVPMVRPLENLCRHCTMRAPLGRSKYCSRCIQIKTGDDFYKFRDWIRNQFRNIPEIWVFLGFGTLVFIIFLALSPLFDLPSNSGFQRTKIKATDRKQK